MKITNGKKSDSIAHWLTSIFIGTSLTLSTSDVNAKRNDQTNSFSDQYELIVKFKDNGQKLSQKSLEQRLTAFNKTNNTALKMKRPLATGAHLISFKPDGNQQKKRQLLSLLTKRSDIEYAVPNYRLYPLATPDDTRYNEQWHYYENTGGINAPAAWDITEGQGAIVAVVDTGYRPHVDLAANIIGGYDFISSSSTARDGDGRDADASDEGDWFGFFECPGAPFNAMNSSWHGTHVAGTIAAVTNNGNGVAGIASQAKVVPVRVLGKCGGTLADIQEGMLWAAGISVSGIPDNANPAHVINLSLGGGAACDAAMQDAVNQITAVGSLVVAAAGNSNANASGFTPASCDNVLTIAATNRSGGKASYSNYGAVVEVAAPGGQTSGGSANGVLSTLNSGTQGPENDSYGFYQGTSMAAPHAAGVAALLYAHKPTTTPAEVTQVLIDTARAFPATCNQCGSGIIDAFAALEAIGGGGNVPPEANFTFTTNNLSVDFNDTSSDSDGSIVSWSWSFGDGNSSSDENPSHTYAAEGDYTVTLTVTDNQGGSDSRSQTVSVSDGTNQPPQSSFSFAVTDLSVSFTDSSSDPDGTVSSWSWDFGDGNSNSAQNPSHTYASAGTYTVTLTVTDDQGASHSSSQQVTVTEPPANNIELTASVSSFWFIHSITLNWNGASGNNVDIYRNGALLTTTSNDGRWSETRYFSGSGTYTVCEAGSNNCSAEVTVNY